MQEYYKIYVPCSKEELLNRIKQTTKPLSFSNQAYKNMILATYREDNETLCIGYTAGGMTGGGLEMLQTQVQCCGKEIILEGRFVLLPYIKRGAQFFLLIMIFLAFVFSKGDILILAEVLIFFIFPLFMLYRNISSIGKCEEGRQLVLTYLENILHAKIEVEEANE